MQRGNTGRFDDFSKHFLNFISAKNKNRKNWYTMINFFKVAVYKSSKRKKKITKKENKQIYSTK